MAEVSSAKEHVLNVWQGFTGTVADLVDVPARLLKETAPVRNASQVFVNFARMARLEPIGTVLPRPIRALAAAVGTGAAFLAIFEGVHDLKDFFDHISGPKKGEADTLGVGRRVLKAAASALFVCGGAITVADWLSKVSVVSRTIATNSITLFSRVSMNLQRAGDIAFGAGATLGAIDNIAEIALRAKADTPVGYGPGDKTRPYLELVTNVAVLGSSILSNVAVRFCPLFALLSATVGCGASLAQFFIKSHEKEPFGIVTKIDKCVDACAAQAKRAKASIQEAIASLKSDLEKNGAKGSASNVTT